MHGNWDERTQIGTHTVLGTSEDYDVIEYQNKEANFCKRDSGILKKLQSILIFFQNLKFQSGRQEM